MLVAPSGTKPTPLRKIFEQAQLLPKAAPTSNRILAGRLDRRQGGEAADQLAHAGRHGVAVIRGRGEGDNAAAVPTVHERIVVQRIVYQSAPRALDMALAE